jgi:hypothetical protein
LETGKNLRRFPGGYFPNRREKPCSANGLGFKGIYPWVFLSHSPLDRGGDGKEFGYVDGISEYPERGKDQ